MINNSNETLAQELSSFNSLIQSISRKSNSINFNLSRLTQSLEGKINLNSNSLIVINSAIDQDFKQATRCLRFAENLKPNILELI